HGVGASVGGLRVPTVPTLAVTAPIDETSLLVIVGVAALAGVGTMLLAPRLTIPVVVLELLLGIIVGPEVAGIAAVDPTTEFLGNLGLGMLFFFAGYEIDFNRIKGQPMKLAGLGWALSLVLAYGIGGALAAVGVVLSYLYTGSAMATTAIGTLIPILSDAGEMKTRFGTYLLAGGAMGEFGPILLITLILSTAHPLHEAVILLLFIAAAVLTGILAVRSAPRGWPIVERTLETSSQLAVRLAVVLVFGLVALAAELGLDLLLGGFVAGMITRQALRDREVGVLESKLTAVGYGLLIPFFFVTSGMEFDIEALTSSAEAVLKMLMFVALFLVVRGTPALLLYRRQIASLRDRAALAFFYATELPLVVAITTIAVDQGHMQSDTAAGLVGAAIISSLAYPLIALRLRRDPGGLEPEPA
ncbi:MAG: cation:proton antiporter, partial [Solirubrobacterales bacterium]